MIGRKWTHRPHHPKRLWGQENLNLILHDCPFVSYRQRLLTEVQDRGLVVGQSGAGRLDDGRLWEYMRDRHGREDD